MHELISVINWLTEHITLCVFLQKKYSRIAKIGLWNLWIRIPSLSQQNQKLYSAICSLQAISVMIKNQKEAVGCSIFLSSSPFQTTGLLRFWNYHLRIYSIFIWEKHFSHTLIHWATDILTHWSKLVCFSMHLWPGSTKGNNPPTFT